MRIVLFILMLFPVIEISLLVLLASHIGLGMTLLYLAASAMLGIWMLKNQKLAALLTIGSLMRQREGISIYSLLWPLRYSLAGVLFIIPGILSEVAGILLLLPLKGPNIKACAPAAGAAAEDGVNEGEFQRGNDPEDNKHKLS